MKHKDLLGRILFVPTALLATLLVGELAVRALSSKKLIYNIEMVKYAKELKIADPETGGQIHRANSSARLMGVDISLNSLGHRSAEFSPKSPEKRRVLVLGSSVTMGWGVRTDQVFTNLTETRLNDTHAFGGKYRFEFGNAGIGNYNTYFQNRLFNRQYSLIQPDMVVLHYFISDAEPRAKATNNPILKYSYLAVLLYDRLRLASFSVVKNETLLSHYEALYADGNPDWAETAATIDGIAKKTAGDGVPFLVMIIPDFHNLAPGSPYEPIYRKIEDRFTALKIPTINTFPVFQKEYGTREPALWIQKDDPHPNELGHKLMADELYRYLTEKDPMKLRGAGR